MIKKTWKTKGTNHNDFAKKGKIVRRTAFLRDLNVS